MLTISHALRTAHHLLLLTAALLTLAKVFVAYAAADKSIQATVDGGLDTLSLPELLFMMREGAMLDDNLTPLQEWALRSTGLRAM